ncbi:uncharacterized protein LOC105181976 isoform X3 [Harpegnathos saltator]|uniref:uncharacterized protein LOC105181976 isoform X3 n=1 Tax=Harpegnathos saltator TaxID=610380 RepID=UPI00058B9EC3|nr:uncharacterized protein LOC105181976 isoform X3 [Harpegnathos saltator]
MGMENKLNDVKERPYRINKHNVLTYDQEKNNPCYKEQILSLKCLDSHQNDRNATVQRERKLKKIEPYLPPIEERAKIKADYLNSR